jgi:hypothetical protein
MSEILPTITTIRAEWTSLHFLEKSNIVSKTLKSGVSLRTLAAATGCDEKTVRNLAICARASVADKAEARSGAISQRELVKRTMAAIKLERKRDANRRRDQNDRFARSGSGQIVQWIRKEGIAFAYGEQIVDRARELIFSAEAAKHGRNAEPTTIRLADPDGSKYKLPFEDEYFVEGYATWLARWLFASYEYPVAYRSLDLAWSALCRR